MKLTLGAWGCCRLGRLLMSEDRGVLNERIRITPKTDPGWYGDNRDRLQQVINERGRCGQSTGPLRPIALFDWDNTVVRNDIGSATAYWMLRNDKIRQPVGGDWRTTSRYLTAAAADALGSRVGSILRTD